eukprot:gene20140-26872_t
MMEQLSHFKSKLSQVEEENRMLRNSAANIRPPSPECTASPPFVPSITMGMGNMKTSLTSFKPGYAPTSLPQPTQLHAYDMPRNIVSPGRRYEASSTARQGSTTSPRRTSRTTPIDPSPELRPTSTRATAMYLRAKAAAQPNDSDDDDDDDLGRRRSPASSLLAYMAYGPLLEL